MFFKAFGIACQLAKHTRELFKSKNQYTSMIIKEELAELIGIIIGDGNIYCNRKIKKYCVEIMGNPKKEVEYFKYISKLFNSVLNKPGKIRIYERGIRIRVYNKNFVNYLTRELNMCYGVNKHSNTKIPSKILESKYLRYCLRGIFDTNGTYFLSKKKGCKNKYPCIEITTCSEKIKKQIKSKLKINFRVKTRELRSESYTNGKVYRISLNGEKETEKWFNRIGSSNKNKLKAYFNFISSKALNNHQNSVKLMGQ